jgi:hypothetical protein
MAVHSLPLHYRPEQSLEPLSQRPLTKQAGKACHTSYNFILTSLYTVLKPAVVTSLVAIKKTPEPPAEILS